MIAFTLPFLCTLGGAWAIWMGYERHFIKLKAFFEYGSKSVAVAPALAAQKVTS